MRRALLPALLLLSAAPLALATSGCDGPRSDRWAHVDEPVRIPDSLGARQPPAAATRAASELDDTAPVDCKAPGAARLDDGGCVLLRTRDVRDTQQVLLPTGRFVAGDIPTSYSFPAAAPPAARWSNNPPRIVNIDSFWIDLAEVTVDAYGACVRSGECTPPSCPGGALVDVNPMFGKRAGQLPQTCVTHAQAEAFCASQIPDGRLPTELELEYAARGPDARIYPWGNENKDELDARLVEIRATKLDRSYFGVLGLASNAAEWSASPWRDDLGLAPYLAGPYRSPDGPAAKARAAFEASVAEAWASSGALATSARRIADDGTKLAPAPPPSEGAAAAQRWVVRHTPSGRRYAARDGHPVAGIERDLDSLYFIQGPALGFRCAADRRAADPTYTLAVEPPGVPLLRPSGVHEIFGGVAEAVSRSEAASFCEQLRVPTAAGIFEDFRLPTRDEIQLVADSFRGPGPFWTVDGAVIQTGGADGAWIAHEVPEDAALLARCIRGG
jgi:hypothetical protein